MADAMALAHDIEKRPEILSVDDKIEVGAEPRWLLHTDNAFVDPPIRGPLDKERARGCTRKIL